ncbi:unnamed protein product, partial [Closterium sp. NIES-54]
TQSSRPWLLKQPPLVEPPLDPEQPPLAPEAAAPGAAAPGLATPPLDPVQPPAERQPCSLGGCLLFSPLATATATGGGQMQLQRRPRESLTPQQLREWYASWGCGGSRRRCRSGAGQLGASGSGQLQLQRRPRETLMSQQLHEWYAQSRGSLSTVLCPYVIRTDIFALDYDAILTAMYALPTSADRTYYLCVPPDPGIEPTTLGAGEAAALGASASPALGAGEAAAPGAGESALFGTAPAEALYTFTLDSRASRSFFRDRTTLTPLSRPVPVSLADPSGGPVLAHSSTVLPCPAVPSGSLSGLPLLAASSCS